MTSCELCGKPAIGKARVEGVIFTVCAGCSQLGQPLAPPPATPARRVAPAHTALPARELVVDFGSRLRSARQHKGLSEEDAAKALNLHKSTLLHFEAGKMHPDDTTARKLERFFGITLFEDV